MGNIIISRNSSNQSAMNLDRMTDYNIQGVGVVNGSGSLVGTRNDKTHDRTVLEFTQADDNAALDVFMTDTKNELHVSGQNVSMGFLSATNSKDVNWDVANGQLDLSNSTAKNTINTQENAKNSVISLGKGNDTVTDSGDYNVFFGTGGNNIFKTTQSSNGAVIFGGQGNDTYDISGSYGVVYAGNGNNTFTLNGDKSMNDAYRNIIFGGAGQNTVWDRGSYSLFLGGSGVNNINMNGRYGIATSGTNPQSKINIWSSAFMSNGFKNVQEAETNMRIKDWVFEDYMDYSGHSDNITNNFVYWQLQSVLPKQ